MNSIQCGQRKGHVPPLLQVLGLEHVSAATPAPGVGGEGVREGLEAQHSMVDLKGAPGLPSITLFVMGQCVQEAVQTIFALGLWEVEGGVRQTNRNKDRKNE